MYSHGCGQFGQLGHGNTDNKSVPTVVEKIQAYRVSQVAVGDHNVFALTSTVLCQFCNMVVDGSVFGWGANQSCQVGAGQSSLYISEPIILRAFNDIRLYKISCGSQHAMAIVDDGGIYAWGKLASNRIQEEPQEVQNFKDNAWDIVSGYDSTFIFCE
jgi:E3 ubiquitin-protein ligase HERC2